MSGSYEYHYKMSIRHLNSEETCHEEDAITSYPEHKPSGVIRMAYSYYCGDPTPWPGTDITAEEFDAAYEQGRRTFVITTVYSEIVCYIRKVNREEYAEIVKQWADKHQIDSKVKRLLEIAECAEACANDGYKDGDLEIDLETAIRAYEKEFGEI